MPLQGLLGRSSSSAQRPETDSGRRGSRDAIVPAAPGRAGLLRECGRAMSDSFLTPWFAVGAGLVLAASIALISPHAALTFPPSVGACGHGRCYGGPATGPGRAEPLAQPEARSQVRFQRVTRGRASPISVRYRLLVGQRKSFMAVILISSNKSLGKWTLRFDLPGIHVDSVMWAAWRSDGSGGLILAGAPMPWPRSGATQARIVISGSGNPRWPRRCVINAAHCTFRELAGP
jgi:hypothetical protein